MCVRGYGGLEGCVCVCGGFSNCDDAAAALDHSIRAL